MQVASFFHYLEANLACIAFFAILLIHDLRSVDRQEKQVKYDYTLIAFMLYFFSDIVWSAVLAGILQRSIYTVVICSFADYVLMAVITLAWLNYVMAVEQVPHRNRPLNRFAVIFPFLLTTLAMILTYWLDPEALLSEELVLQPAFFVFLLIVPFIYIASVMIYAMRRAKMEDNPIERRKHIYIGFFPLVVVVGGLVEVVLLPHTPIFCFSATALMLIFYIKALDTQISVDPLTHLNNRGQLLRYISQHANLHIDGRQTFVIMLDVNDFKLINDTYGHAEGDRALVIIAEAIATAVRGRELPAFIGRYGGDEFILIVHPQDKSEMESLIREIRERIADTCRDQQTPFWLSIGAGYDELLDGQDTIQKCMQRADKKLYLDKEYIKLHYASPSSEE